VPASERVRVRVRVRVEARYLLHRLLVQRKHRQSLQQKHRRNQHQKHQRSRHQKHRQNQHQKHQRNRLEAPYLLHRLLVQVWVPVQVPVEAYRQSLPPQRR